MSLRLCISGRREAAQVYEATVRGPAIGEGAKPVTDLLDGVRVVDAFDLSLPAREGEPKETTIDVGDDDILEIEVEGGFTLWTSAARYGEQLEFYDSEAVTAEGLRLGALPQPSATDRGIKNWVTNALRVLRLERDQVIEELSDPRKWPDVAKDFLKGKAEGLGVWATTKLLMYLIEQRLTPAPGLYRWPTGSGSTLLDLSGAKRVSEADLPCDRPLLVFIHGTASSTVGSFGALVEPEASAQWKTLQGFFGEHIYAFEHRTLSDSPIENAVELSQSLPAGARLYLVSHSRGGLVGDLLSLTDITDARIGLYQRPNRDLREADEHDRKYLKRLGELLRAKKFRVERFVRVACPARGTLLASENIDQFLSILTYLIGLIPGLSASPIYHVVKRVTLEVARRRTDPNVIPGIEAMVPGSPLVAFLNAAEPGAAGDLGVIAGDIEGGGWLKRLGVFIADRFVYDDRDHDLVVNTDSMFFGAPRSTGAHYAFDQGADVSHFNYFRNERSRSAVARWLTARPGQVPTGFDAIDSTRPEPVPNLRSIQKRAKTAQPVVFVLPGIMGSHLAVNGKRVWLDYWDLLRGGLEGIKDVKDPRVKPVALIGDYYAALCQYLSDTHEVVPLAYDWRKSIAEAASALAREVEKALERTTQPVRLAAHSMGGLVVRRMIKDRGDIWDRICERPGGRFLMLGTPNRGSHAMVETLLGVATTVRQLALLDVTRGLQGVLDLIAGFPGAVELLPQEDCWFKPETWDGLRRANRNLAGVPSHSLLNDAKGTLDQLPEHVPHVERVLYVAGTAPSTPCGAEIDRGRLQLSTTNEGDGRVTHEAGKLPGVATWYAKAEHGELAAFKPAFPALLELLEHGKTTLLATTPPSATRGGKRVMRYSAQPVLYPTETDLVAGLMGRRVKAYRRRVAPAIAVSVLHGDLRYARFPVMIGHYEGDTIAGAEGYLDHRLRGALSERYQLGLYPGTLGSTAVVLPEQTVLQKELGIPRGAVVIGLGRMGELSSATLANAIREGALHYVIQRSDQTVDDSADGIATPQREVGLSVLLIGCNSASSVSVEDSVGAILRGIAQATRELERGKARVRIAHVEIIELFADSAIQAAHALQELAPSVAEELDVHIEATPQLRLGRNGLVRLAQPQSVKPWRRWEITAIAAPPPEDGVPLLPRALTERLKESLSDQDKVDADAWRAVVDLVFHQRNHREEPHLGLRYLALSDRARAEVIVQQRQPELIEKFVQLSIRDTRFRLETARTLGELLLPNELKDAIAQQSRLVLVLDDETATYPWELMVLGGEPLCVRLGMVRQLQIERYRSQIRATTARTAYVVGDPLTGDNVPPLPGAREEARLVALLLEQGYTVTRKFDRPTALEVLDGLFAGPYRILHLAGHGFYEARSPASAEARSGILLEGGLFLTAVEIAQMRQVPDLVFLNCCHLAQVGLEQKHMPGRVAYNKLAASISRELIGMGVRAVVAAGWAVRDDAANFFAKAFYEALLGGATFGDGLHESRGKTWQRFPDCNTWGAYQAYGDPDFRLDPGRESTWRPADEKAKPAFVAPEEVVSEVDFITTAAQDPSAPSGPGKTQTSPEARLKTLESACRTEWLARGDVLSAFARAYGDLGQFEAAIHYYERALTAEKLDEEVTLKSVEQFASLEARWGEKTNQVELIERAIKHLRALVKLGKTGERLSLLGSAYKRLAKVSADSSTVAEALKQAAHYYQRAAQWSLDRNQFDPYPVLNWLTLEALLGSPVADAETWLSRCEATARERFVTSRAFWDAVTLPDGELVRRLLQGTLDGTAVEKIVLMYRETQEEASASQREFDSVASQLSFIEQMLGKLERVESSPAREAVQQMLARLSPPVARTPQPGSAAELSTIPARQRRPRKRPPAKRAGTRQKPTGK